MLVPQMQVKSIKLGKHDCVGVLEREEYTRSWRVLDAS